MQINTSLSVDPSAVGVVKNRLASNLPPTPAPSSQNLAPEFDLNRLQALDGDTGIPDESGANQALAFLQSNFLAQPGSAIAAQANLNPESAYALLV
jgi:hypothetical protein